MLALAANGCAEIGGNQRRSDSGTDRATITSSNVHAHSGTDAAKLGHGGARNRADRVSYHLAEQQVRAIFAAVTNASAIGLPLNRHWTVHWDRAGVTDDKAGAATGALLALVRDWLRKQGHRFACVWVRENDEGDASKGSHVHILLHLPTSVKWCGWRNRRWLERVSGRLYAPLTSQTRVVGRSRSAAKASPASYHANLWTMAGYVSKSAPASVLKALEIGRRPESGGIIGKRWGRSLALSSNGREGLLMWEGALRTTGMRGSTILLA